MPYELLSRSLAYISCLSTFSLALTSVAFAAVHVGKAQPQAACGATYCQSRYEPVPLPGSITDRALKMHLRFAAGNVAKI